MSDASSGMPKSEVLIKPVRFLNFFIWSKGYRGLAGVAAGGGKDILP
jgi:hypothetical protein